MTRRLCSIAGLILVALTAGLLLGGSPASGQNKARLYIPFAFTANHQELPAGYYSVELLSDRFLCFSNSRTGEHKAVIMVRPEAAPYIETRGRLRFIMHNEAPQHEKQRHYLSEVQFAGSSMHSMTVIQPGLARELGRNTLTASTVDLPMRPQR